ncbi:Ubiquitin carboxyl-terminal hydrolase 27 [Linum perenne]
MIQNYFSSPQMKWGLASGFHLPLAAAVLGAAGFVVAVIRHRQLGNLSGLLKGRREEVLLVPGLQNLGNNCFLNVILQALASCSLFQPFLQKMIEDCESDDWGDGLQLTVALASLLEDLCACGEGKVVLSPRQVMLAMAQYIRNFNLTSQQDAEEAFLHLLSSLREEFSDCYLPKQSSLSEIVDTFYSRILTPKRHETRNEKERWQQHFLGPFDGILSSTLICQTCSSQMVGCTLEDCLKRFIAAEQLENYHCSHCWHVAAVKYLCLQGALEGDVEKIMRCTERDSCTCRSLFDLDSLPWSNIFSRTLKGLSIARCPKILCIHLQRASINHFGEPIKLQGHICFPLVLDLLPFTLKELQSEKRIPHSNKPNMPSDPEVRACISGQDLPSEELLAEDKLGCSEQLQTIAGESKLVETKVDVEIITDTIFPNQDKVLSSDAYMYRLVSVVEHFGRSGGGHYTVYRSAKCDSPEDSVQNLHWFCVSDSQVSRVSEEDVLAAEASLLFYERIAQC